MVEFSTVDSLKIERAIALVDPMGLIAMGAPLDEYSNEAQKISSHLENRAFDENEFLESYANVMKEGFGEETFEKFMEDEKETLLTLIKKDDSLREQFVVGEIYRVPNRSPNLSELEIQFAECRLISGDVVTCVGRKHEETIGYSSIYLMINGTIECAQRLSRFSEFRARWFFEEVR